MQLPAVGSQLLATTALLTRLPIRLTVWPAPERCVWAYPIVGAGIGACGAAMHAALVWAGLPPLMSALWTVAGQILLTGALHEDGLADCCDAFGGTTREWRLRIMRDSRIGSFGVLALVVATLGRIAAIASLGRDAGVALVVAGALSRAAILGVVLLIPPARPDGLGAALGQPVRGCAAGLASSLLSLLLLPAGHGIAAVAAALLAGVSVAVTARRSIGGQTGDVLGAAAQLAECLVLTVLTAA